MEVLLKASPVKYFFIFFIMLEIVKYRTIRKKPKYRNGSNSRTAMITVPKRYIGRRAKVIIDSIRKKDLHYNYG